MPMPLQEVLKSRFGVSEDEFAAALVEFADRVGPSTLVEIRPIESLRPR